MNKGKKKSLLKLVDYNCKAKSWTARDMITDLDKEPHPERFKKGIVILLDDSEGGYDTRKAVAGMDRREIVALLETMKLKYLRMMAGDDGA